MTMKKTKFWLIFLFVTVLSVSCYGRSVVIKTKDLPAPARNIVKNHFKGRNITKAEKESDLDGVTYEVTLDNGDEITFNSNGGWVEIECMAGVVPFSVIPVAIANYVKKNYPNVPIRKIERGHKNYEVELSNEIEIHFNKNDYKVVRVKVDD